MKKILLVVVCAFLATGAFAQTWGVKAGLNLANITDGDADMKPSIYVGVTSQFSLSDVISLQPELVYSRQGAKDGDLKTRLNYLNVPIMVNFAIGEKFALLTGPQAGFLLNAKVTDGDNSIDIKDEMDAKTFDFTWGFGAAYAITEKISIDARYNLGLSKISGLDGVDSKNSVIQVGLAYNF